MATLDGYLADIITTVASSSKGRFVTFSAYLANLGQSEAIIRYAMQATCDTSPTGYINWINETGDNVNRPVCAGIGGPPQIITSWSI